MCSWTVTHAAGESVGFFDLIVVVERHEVAVERAIRQPKLALCSRCQRRMATHLGVAVDGESGVRRLRDVTQPGNRQHRGCCARRPELGAADPDGGGGPMPIRTRDEGALHLTWHQVVQSRAHGCTTKR